MNTLSCDWTLTLLVKCSLSIRQVILMTNNKINIIAGQNGCGKSHLLDTVHSYYNSLRDQFLQDKGYSNLWPKGKKRVHANGPTNYIYIYPRRIIGKAPEERIGPFSFEELQQKTKLSQIERYYKFRFMLSKLAYDSECHSISWVRGIRKDILNIIVKSFPDLFPGRSLMVDVDHEKKEVSVYAQWQGMGFVRPDDERFKESLLFSLATLSDGELNALFLLYEFLVRSHAKNTRPLFLVDEIENHLHPELQERFMKLLIKVFPKWSMLLATTHSPAVLASVPPKSIFFMVHSTEKDKKGKYYENQILPNDINHPVAEILYKLYGAGSSNIASILLGDVHRITSAGVLSYAVECLLDPDVRDESKSYDPQRVAVASFLQGVRERGELLKILDIGAGKGKVIKGLRENFRGHETPWVQFDLVDPNNECREVLGRLAASRNIAFNIGNIFEKLSDIPSDAKYKIIFLHNVLHELTLSEIVELLEMIRSLIYPSGLVHVMEQNVLPKGEIGHFVFEPLAIVSLLNHLGFKVKPPIQRDSYGRIPLYEITGHLEENPNLIGKGEIRQLVINAIEKTLSLNLKAYEAAVNERDDPLLIAFLAHNMANGRIRLL